MHQRLTITLNRGSQRESYGLEEIWYSEVISTIPNYQGNPSVMMGGSRQETS
jgi:hypothetical protein